MGPFFSTICLKRPVDVVLEEDDAIVVVLPKQKRRGERGVLAFLEEMTTRGTLQAGEVLVTDNERSWTTPEVKTYLAAHGITHLLYPKYLGARLDPCDNSFHCMFRRCYDKRMLQTGRIGLSGRLRVLYDAYKATPTEAILGCMRRCGTFEGDPEHVMAELLCEGRRRSLRISKAQKRCVDAYLAYCRDNHYCEPDEADALRRRDARSNLLHMSVVKTLTRGGEKRNRKN
jgi:hypothetical protein